MPERRRPSPSADEPVHVCASGGWVLEVDLQFSTVIEIGRRARGPSQRSGARSAVSVPRLSMYSRIRCLFKYIVQRIFVYFIVYYRHNFFSALYRGLKTGFSYTIIIGILLTGYDSHVVVVFSLSTRRRLRWVCRCPGCREGGEIAGHRDPSAKHMAKLPAGNTTNTYAQSARAPTLRTGAGGAPATCRLPLAAASRLRAHCALFDL